MPWRGVGIALAVIAVGLASFGRAGDLLVDWAWFDAVGYSAVFWTILEAKAALFVAIFVVSTALLWANATLALRGARRNAPGVPLALDPRLAAALTFPEPAPQLFGLPAARLPWAIIAGALAVVLGGLIAAGEAANWDLVLRYLEQAPYGQTDPVFDLDIGFYLFTLPAYVAFKNWLLVTWAFAALGAGAVYWAHGHVMLDRRPPRLSPAAIAHGSALLGIVFAIKAGSYALDRYLLLYDDNGVVVGAGYTDLHVDLPVLWLLIGLAAAASLVSWANMRVRSYRLPVIAVLAVFGSSFALAIVLPGLFQRIYVRPNELQLETPYIARNIALTREAFNLRQVTVKPFAAAETLSFQSLQQNRATIDNIRLWDWQPLMDTYAQLQEIRTYYKFRDVDVDRYELDGTYQQVMLTARELAPSLLPPNAQTWVNLHVLFTHGIGAVMSPVTQKTSEGLPAFYLKDIPPVASGGPAIREPRVYFGQGPDGYVIVKGSTAEFDYPKGKDNVYAFYDGSDGVPIGDLAHQALFAWYFGDPNLLLSGYITAQSRIMFRRNIQERARTIAPFLMLDHDPYVVVSDGRLFWIQDAYTTSRWFPYAQPHSGTGTTYIRNSIKIVIDAYNGTVTFYLADPADAIAATYQRIFPDLFKPLAAMPADLKRHVRYPEDLFLIQAQQYRAYHMDAPEVFYNREDLWQFPRQPNSVDAPPPSFAARTAPYPTNFIVPSQATSRMAPYYIVMRLPGEPRAEFFIMLPMVPSQRENMIAWMAARCDVPDYGKLIVYEFPKEKLVYGPFQIEARINQNTDISQQISLWNQMGSRVIRGNLLVIPVEDSILYVSPLYLRAESGQLPELKRVIAAYDERVVMEETLPAALAALFKDSAPAAALAATHSEALPAGPVGDRARAALEHYRRALERLKAGDWAGFGAELDALGPLLEELGATARQ